MTDVVSHAQRELELMGEEPEIVAGYLMIIQTISNFEESGIPASVVFPIVNELLKFNHLSALTDDPGEWEQVCAIDSVECSVWRNKRNKEAYSNDAGNTYFLLSESYELENPSPIHDSKKRE